jgi:hypothetical protein
MAQLDSAEHAVRMGGKRAMVKPKGSAVKVDRIDWLRGEVARLEKAVLESRERCGAGVGVGVWVGWGQRPRPCSDPVWPPRGRTALKSACHLPLAPPARALVLNCSPAFFVLFRTQKAAAIASSCTIHPLRRQLFQVGRGTRACGGCRLEP